MPKLIRPCALKEGNDSLWLANYNNPWTKCDLNGL